MHFLFRRSIRIARGIRLNLSRPGMRPAEHQRRGDAAEALWRDLVAVATVRRA